MLAAACAGRRSGGRCRRYVSTSGAYENHVEDGDQQFAAARIGHMPLPASGTTGAITATPSSTVVTVANPDTDSSPLRCGVHHQLRA